MKRKTKRMLVCMLACTVALTSWLFFKDDGMELADTSVRLVDRPMPPALSGRRNRAGKHPKHSAPPWRQGVSGRPHKNKKRRK